jgi:hypothetical protein
VRFISAEEVEFAIVLDFPPMPNWEGPAAVPLFPLSLLASANHLKSAKKKV